ncbi:TniB family NTP-binding protein [Janibacter sp. LM]|uniref:TniB family NTP-binding protein n=1 Tax=Janibacter sp. LM TaxID=3144845 RepID=UPI0031F688A8
MKAELLHSLAFTPAIGPPPPITTQDATGMSHQERRARAAEVRRYLAGHYFDSERDRGIRQRLTALIEGNAQSLTGTKDVAIVTGDNVLGKSTMLYQVAFDAHRRLVAPHTDPHARPVNTARSVTGRRVERLEVDHVPVLFLSLAAGTTVAKFNAQIVQALGYPPGVEKRVRYLDLLERHGVRLLIVDDLHLLKTSLKLGREALDHLKAVVTAVGELGATVILAGANLHTHPVMDDPQVTDRAYEVPVAPYTGTTKADRLAFRQFLRECATHAQPYLPAGQPEHIWNQLPHLWLERSAGYHRDLLQLLRDATTAAIEDGTWAITEKHLTGVTLAARAERRNAHAARPRATVPGSAPSATADPRSGASA